MVIGVGAVGDLGLLFVYGKKLFVRVSFMN